MFFDFCQLDFHSSQTCSRVIDCNVYVDDHSIFIMLNGENVYCFIKISFNDWIQDIHSQYTWKFNLFSDHETFKKNKKKKFNFAYFRRNNILISFEFKLALSFIYIITTKINNNILKGLT